MKASVGIWTRESILFNQDVDALDHTIQRPHRSKNGKAERGNRMIGQGARTLLYYNKVLTQLLAEAVNWMIYVLNRSLSTFYHSKTPLEPWYENKPFYPSLPHSISSSQHQMWKTVRVTN